LSLPKISSFLIGACIGPLYVTDIFKNFLRAFGIVLYISDFTYTLTESFFPSQTSRFSIGLLDFAISIKSKLVNPQVISLALSLDLSFLELKPLPTAINRLPFLYTEEAKEYFQ
jgi:hypothetical protein